MKAASVSTLGSASSSTDAETPFSSLAALALAVGLTLFGVSALAGVAHASATVAYAFGRLG
jgi:hypothetical protein